MTKLNKIINKFKNWLFSIEDNLPDTCRETFQKELYKKSTGSDFDVDKEIKHHKFPVESPKMENLPEFPINFKKTTFEPSENYVDGLTKDEWKIKESSLPFDSNDKVKKTHNFDHTDNFKFESPNKSFRNSAEKEYFDDKIITPLSDKEKEELNTLFAEEILPYATLEKTFEEPHVTSGYLHIDDPTFINAATSYVDNSQKVEHQLDEQKSEEIKTKKNKTKYNKNKKK